MTNTELLELIRLDRPDYTIHNVLDFQYNEILEIYECFVDMRLSIAPYGTTHIIEHSKQVIPYPLKTFQNLSQKAKDGWTGRNIFNQ